MSQNDTLYKCFVDVTHFVTHFAHTFTHTLKGVTHTLHTTGCTMVSLVALAKGKKCESVCKYLESVRSVCISKKSVGKSVCKVCVVSVCKESIGDKAW